MASVQAQGSWIMRRPCSWQQAPRVSTHARSLLPGGSPFRSEWQPLPAMSTHRGSSLPLSYGRRGDQLGEFDLPGLPRQREPDVNAHIGSLLPRGLPSGSGWQPLDGERGGRIGLVSPDAGGLCPEADGGSSPPYRGKSVDERCRRVGKTCSRVRDLGRFWQGRGSSQLSPKVWN